MLDSWEDDSRRRRRFMRNPYGSAHCEAILVSSKDARQFLFMSIIVSWRLRGLK